MNDDQNNHDEQPGTDVEQAALAHPDVQAGLAEAKAGKTVKRQKPVAVADGEQAASKPRRQLKIDKTAGEVLDKFATLNSLGFAPSVQEVLDRASEVACRHIATMYDQATNKMQKLEP